MSSNYITIDNEIQVQKTLLAKTSHNITQAKLKELEEWKRESVYLELEDNNQECISLWWVIKEKLLRLNIYCQG